MAVYRPDTATKIISKIIIFCSKNTIFISQAMRKINPILLFQYPFQKAGLFSFFNQLSKSSSTALPLAAHES